MKTGHPSKKDYVFVSIQLLLFAAYIVPFKIIHLNINTWLKHSGLALMVLGLILGVIALLQINTKISPFPTPTLQSTLLTTGAFNIGRHPIYTGILAITLGYAVYNASLFKFIIFVLLLILFYFKSNYEEQLLLEKFPEYATYKIKTRRFI
ncbi:isoprenylcysteine carboxylmethyltransferase family protein [Formosa sp. L2A11]|uniref:methyltransferase family protein n=1 Tax=Formosa sp. L2A11 TaxID=2686363 RepID=UPI00131C91DF|nr:isoprenylcysteine carboxylmethyltransferase family protein [Formosa sp. L2A11]